MSVLSACIGVLLGVAAGFVAGMIYKGRIVKEAQKLADKISQA